MTDAIVFMTAVVVLVTGIASLIATITVHKTTNRQIKEVHVLVNSRMREMVQRVDQLTAALQAADTEVPPPAPRDDT